MTNVVEFTPEFVLLLLVKGGDFNVRDYTGRTVILYAAHYDGISPHFDLLELLLESDDISRVDKIDALEMAGAVLFSNEENHEEAIRIRYWRRALSLRLMNTKESQPIFKTPTNSKNGVLAEWSTEEDLLRIELNPSQREIQSLLVQLRIFSSLGWRAIHQHFMLTVRNLLSKGLHGERSISQILDFLWVLCNTIISCERPYESDLPSSLEKIACWLIFILNGLPKDDPTSF